MARILFGGPQEDDQHNPVHDDLVAKLEETHHVDYVNSGEAMLHGLNLSGALTQLRNQAGLETQQYNLVIYDTGLFFPCDNITDSEQRASRRAELFDRDVISYLKTAQLPVMVLADQQIADRIRHTVEQANFTQIDQPYRIDDVVEKVEFYVSLVNEP